MDHTAQRQERPWKIILMLLGSGVFFTVSAANFTEGDIGFGVLLGIIGLLWFNSGMHKLYRRRDNKLLENLETLLDEMKKTNTEHLKSEDEDQEHTR